MNKNDRIETSADLTALEKKGLDRKTNHRGLMKAGTQPRPAKPTSVWTSDTVNVHVDV